MAAVRRLILIGIVVLVTMSPGGILAPLAGAASGSAAGGAALPPPVAVQFLCEHQGNHRLSFTATADGCHPSNETLLRIPQDGPIFACASNDVRRVANLNQCGSGQIQLTLPGPTILYFCVANGNNRLQYTTNPNQCNFAVFVAAANQPPVAANDSYSTPEDTPLNVAAPGVLGNDSDPDGNPLTAVPGADPVHGTLTLNTNGSFTYTPATNYNGPDSFTYQARDPSGALSSLATVSITVTPVNDPPTAASQTVPVDEDAPATITLGAADIDSPALTFSIVAGPTNGTLGPIGAPTCTPAGAGGTCTATVTYTPAANFNGADSFTFRANDGGLDSNVATVTLSVAAANDPPTTQPDSYTATGNTPLAVGGSPGGGPVVHIPGGSVKSNDSDPEGDPITIGPAAITSANGGSVSMNADGTFTYLPAAGFTGTDSFGYTATDSHGASTSGSVSIVVAQLVWYVNNAAAGGDGRANSPFNSLTALQGAGDPDGAGDIIFVYAGSGSYGGMALEAGQKLIGEAVGLVVGTTTLVPAGGAPTLTNAGGAGITLASDNTVQGLTVDGTGGAGILATNANNTAIDRVTIRNTGRSGIVGTGIANFSFTNGTIENSGTLHVAGSQDANLALNVDPGVEARNVSGALTITGSTLTNAYFHGIDIYNGAGTLTSVTISGNTIVSSTDGAASLGSGLRLRGNGSDSTVSNVTRATIANNTIRNFPNGAGIIILGGNTFSATAPGAVFGTPGSATDIIAITGNAIAGASPTNRMGTNAIITALAGSGQGNFDISGNGTAANPITNIAGNVIANSAIGQVSVTSTIANNVIVANHSAGLGGALGISGGTAPQFGATDAPSLTATVSGNAISNTDGNGILLSARAATGTLRAKVQNNVVAAPLSGVRQGIRIDSGSAGLGNDTVCLNVAGNTSAGSGGALGIGLRKQGTNPALNTFGINGMAATSSPGVELYVAGLNPAGGGARLISATSGFSNCSLP